MRNNIERAQAFLQLRVRRPTRLAFDPVLVWRVGFGRRPCCCQIRPHYRHSVNIFEGFNLAHVLVEADISRGVVDPYWRV
jgi:hypothetical protein